MTSSAMVGDGGEIYHFRHLVEAAHQPGLDALPQTRLAREGNIGAAVQILTVHPRKGQRVIGGEEGRQPLVVPMVDDQVENVLNPGVGF